MAKRFKAFTFTDPTKTIPEKIRIVCGKDALELYSQEERKTCLSLPWEEVAPVTGSGDSTEDMDIIKFTHKTNKHNFELEIEDKMELVRNAMNAARDQRLKAIARGKIGGAGDLMSRMGIGSAASDTKKTKAEIALEQAQSMKAASGGQTMNKFEQRKAQFEAAKAEIERQKKEAKAVTEKMAAAAEAEEDNKGDADKPAAGAIHELLLTMKIKQAADIQDDINATIYKDRKIKKKKADGGEEELVVTDASEKARLVRELREACDVGTYKGHELAPLPKFTGANTEIKVVSFRKKGSSVQGEKSRPELHLECTKSSTPLGQIVKEGQEDFAYKVTLTKRYSECAYLHASLTPNERNIIEKAGFLFPAKWPRSRCMIIIEKWFNEICRKSAQTYLMVMKQVAPTREHLGVLSAERVRVFFDETTKTKKDVAWKTKMATEMRLMTIYNDFVDTNLHVSEAIHYWNKDWSKSGFAEAPHVDMLTLGGETYRNKEPTHELRKLRTKMRKILTRQDEAILQYEKFRGERASTKVLTVEEKRANSKEFRIKKSKLRIEYDRGDEFCRICQQHFVPGDRTRLLLATPPELMHADESVENFKQCGHSFHAECIGACINVRTKKPKCPVCLVLIDKSLMVGKHDADKDKDKVRSGMTAVLRVKDEDIDKMLEDKRNEKNEAMEKNDYTRATALHKEIAVLEHKARERDEREAEAEETQAKKDEEEAAAKLEGLKKKKKKAAAAKK
jgi:hypothetical protein